MRDEARWRVAAAVGIALFLAASASAPVAGPVIDALRWAHSGVDYHPDASHSFFLAGRQSVQCARNTGLYTGALLLLASAWATGRGRTTRFPSRPVALALALGFGVMVLDGLNAVLGDLGYPTPYRPTIWGRLGTGLLAGVAVAAAALPVANGILWRAPDRRPIVPGLRALGAALLAPLLLWIGVVLRVDTLALPVALLTTAATLVLFGGVNLLVLVLARRAENRYAAAPEIARPFGAGVALAVAQVGLLAWLVLEYVAPGSGASLAP